MRFYLGTESVKFKDKPLDRLHVIEILPDELDTLERIPMNIYYEKSQFRYCKYCDKEIEINDKNVIVLDRGIYFCPEHYQHEESLTPLSPVCNQCNKPFKLKTDFYLIETGEISKSKTTYFQCQCKEYTWLIFKLRFGTHEGFKYTNGGYIDFGMDPNYTCLLNDTHYYEDYENILVKIRNKELGDTIKKSSLFLRDFLYMEQPKKYRQIYRIIEEVTKTGIQLEVLNLLCNAHRRLSHADHCLGINRANSLEEIMRFDYTYFDNIIEEKIKSTVVSIRSLFDESVPYSLLKWKNKLNKHHKDLIDNSYFYKRRVKEKDEYEDSDINKIHGKRIINQGILHQDDTFLDKFEKKFGDFQTFVKTNFVNNLTDFYKDFIPPFLNRILRNHKLSIQVDDTIPFSTPLDISIVAKAELYNLIRHRDDELAHIKHLRAQQQQRETHYEEDR